MGVFKHIFTSVFSSLCLWCFTIVVSDSDINKVLLYTNQTKDFFDDEHVNEHYKYIEKWYVVSSQHKVTIIPVDYEALSIRCATEVNKHLKTEEGDDNGPTITINSNDLITGIWSCKLWTKLKQNVVIYFRLRVKETMPPQQILVNHIDLNLKKDKDIYTAEYFYQEGETVDVDCISSDETCTVQMSNPFSVINDNYNVPAWGFGFPAKLHSEHNRTKVKCISNCSGIESTVELTFVLQDKLMKNMNRTNVKINNRDITRNVELVEESIYNVNYAYFYNNNEQIKITCDTNINKTPINISCENCFDGKKEKIPIDQRTEVTVVPNMISVITCITEKQITVIRFQLVPCRDDSQLTLQGLIRDNILSEHHAYKYHQGISYTNYTYEYENSNPLALYCAINLGDNLNHGSQYISLNNSDKKTSNYRIKLSMEYNNKPVVCLLHDSVNKKKNIAQIWILFRLKSQPVTTTTTEVNLPPKASSTEEPNSTVTLIVDHGNHNDQENNNSGNDHKDEGEQYLYQLWIPVVIVSIIIGIICVVIVKSKKMRNRLSRREPEHTYDYCVVNDINPHDPAQSEIEYAVPEGEMEENSLYQRTKDFYAKVIPKSQRQRVKQQSINATTNKSKEYEEDAGADFLVMNSPYSSSCLEPKDRSDPTKSVRDNQETSRKASANLEMLSVVYSEPINKIKSQEDTYTNVTGEPHYSNKMGGYCVYPTYSEPHIEK